jgi:hypothetical protein
VSSVAASRNTICGKFAAMENSAQDHAIAETEEAGALTAGTLRQDDASELGEMAASFRQLAKKYDSAIVLSKARGAGIPAILIYTTNVRCILESSRLAKDFKGLKDYFIVYTLPAEAKDRLKGFTITLAALDLGFTNTMIFDDVVVYFYSKPNGIGYATENFFYALSEYYRKYHLAGHETEARPDAVTDGSDTKSQPIPEEILDHWLAAKGIPDNERAAYAAKINRIVASVGRPQWAERRLRPDLAHLSAPRFLRAVYPDALDAQGRLIDEELVRLSDPTLVGVVQAYIAQLKKNPSRTLGDAAGLVFTRKDNRGRPEKPQRRRKRHSPGP